MIATVFISCLLKGRVRIRAVGILIQNDDGNAFIGKVDFLGRIGEYVLVNLNICRVASKKIRIIHLEAEYPGAMFIIVSIRKWGVKIQNDQLSPIHQDAINLAGNFKKIFSVA
jgi:hypothetical protein